MNALDLNRRVVVQQIVAGDNASGEPSSAWVDFATVMAKITDMSGRQYMAAEAAKNAVLTEITIRYRPGVVPSMRVLHGTVLYDIKAVLGQDRRWLTLMCERGVNNG